MFVPLRSASACPDSDVIGRVSAVMWETAEALEAVNESWFGKAPGIVTREEAALCRREIEEAVALVSGVSEPSVWQLEVNLTFNLAMARLKYRMIPAPLPDGRDVWAMARYWHRWYCANGYPGQVEQFVADWFRFCA